MELPLLIGADALARVVQNPKVRVIETTAFLHRDPARGGSYEIESGRRAYEAGHIPGAVFADIPEEFSDPEAPYPLTVPSPDRFAAAIGRLGVANDHHVVVYAAGPPFWATRLWWLLRYFGHDAVSVLDGGTGGWVAAGYPLEAGSRENPPVTFLPLVNKAMLAQMDDVMGIVQTETGQLVNALSESAFRGLDPYPAYSRPGRIPRSLNVPAHTLIDPATNRFRGADEMKAVLQGAGLALDRPVVTYCGAGIAGTVPLFALALQGHPDVRLYDGSLTEWSARPDLPMETG